MRGITAVKVDTGGKVEVGAGGTGLAGAGVHPVPNTIINAMLKMVFLIDDLRYAIINLLICTIQLVGRLVEGRAS
jgi:hypothetical protein